MASSNLVSTYYALGGATPGSTIWQEEGFNACIGPFEHPICNFASGLDIDPWSARRLHEVASTRSCFNVFSMPVDRPAHRDELLCRAGFRQTYQLFQMVVEPSIQEQPLELIASDGGGERLAVAEFMARQFFLRQPEAFRCRMAQATASSSLDLYSLTLNGSIAGAVMVVDEGGALGIYNLCVSPSHRGQGWGAAIVKSIVKKAAELDRLVTLQCEERLAGWYHTLGFRSVGLVQVYACLGRGQLL